MKLLKKTAVSTEIANSRKMQMDEGILIAKKVDALREKLASLETQNALFIKKTVEELKNQTQGLNDGIDAKKKELLKIEEERVRLLEPLDKEWQKANAQLIENQASKRQIELGLQRIDEKEAKIVSMERQTKQILSNIKIRERELERAFSKSVENEHETSNVLSGIRQQKLDHEDYFVNKNQEFLEREAGIAVKERENQIEIDRIELEKLEIIKTKAQLEDQRATLERALQRTK